MKNNAKWIKEKAFLVTGGSSGIGLAISTELLKYGAKVVAISHNESEFIPASALLKDYRENIQFYKCDITNKDDRSHLLKFLTELKYDWAGMINSAGITTYGSFFDTPITGIERLLSVNFTGTIVAIREFFSLFLQNPPQTIKYLGFISSTSAKVPFPYFGGYPGTKVGVEMVLKTLSYELPKNVKILVVRPGPVNTNLYKNAITAPKADIQSLSSSSKRLFTSPEQVAKAVVKKILKQKKGTFYPSLSAKIQVYLMKIPIIGKIFIKLFTYGLKRGVK